MVSCVEHEKKNNLGSRLVSLICYELFLVIPMRFSCFVAAAAAVFLLRLLSSDMQNKI